MALGSLTSFKRLMGATLAIWEFPGVFRIDFPALRSERTELPGKTKAIVSFYTLWLNYFLQMKKKNSDE